MFDFSDIFSLANRWRQIPFKLICGFFSLWSFFCAQCPMTSIPLFLSPSLSLTHTHTHTHLHIHTHCVLNAHTALLSRTISRWFDANGLCGSTAFSRGTPGVQGRRAVQEDHWKRPNQLKPILQPISFHGPMHTAITRAQLWDPSRGLSRGLFPDTLTLTIYVVGQYTLTHIHAHACTCTHIHGCTVMTHIHISANTPTPMHRYAQGCAHTHTGNEK